MEVPQEGLAVSKMATQVSLLSNLGLTNAQFICILIFIIPILILNPTVCDIVSTEIQPF